MAAKRWFLHVALAIAWLGFAATGCGDSLDRAESEHEPVRSCSRSADCYFGEQCLALISASGLPNTPYEPDPSRCTYQVCLSSAGCSSGQVCRPMEEIGNAAYCALDIKVCHLSCQTLPCLGLDRCEVSGECAPVACDKDPGVVCPANHRCDPKRAAQITYSSEFGRNGCVPLPCEDTGHCADDATHICDPSTAMDQRYAGNRDYHGCRKRRCDENVACPADYICVPAAADTDPFGCVLQGTCRAP